MFSKQTYIDRRKKLAAEVGSGLILLAGNDESPMNYADNCYHFRQDSTFLYYTGIDFPGLFLVIDIEKGTETLFGDDYTIDHIVWMGPQPTISERAATSGIANSKPISQLENVLSSVQKSAGTIHLLPVYRPEIMLRLEQWMGLNPAQIQCQVSLALTKAVIKQREIKTDEELVEIEKAVDVSVKMHVAAMQFARPGMLESEVAAKVYETALMAGCELSFPIIATINGQTLHNHYHGNRIQEGDLFLLDAGAEMASHYAGDLSSTFPVGKTFTTQQKIIYEMSLQAHTAAIDALQLNQPFRNAHLAACRSITESMQSIGLMKGNVDDAITAGAHALFLPCGTGHMMGLDVHDMENLGEIWVGYDGVPKSTQFGLKSLRLAKPLQPGHVFTVEPGIYFIPELMDKWMAEKLFADFINWEEVQKYRNFGGIRNEENYMMTSEGARRLGSLVKPKTIEEVETIRSQDK